MEQHFAVFYSRSEIAKSHTKNQVKAVVGSVLFTTLLGMSASANADNYDPSQSDYDSSLVFDTNKSYFLQNDAALTIEMVLKLLADKVSQLMLKVMLQF